MIDTILAIDTLSTQGSVALYRGADCLASSQGSGERRHAREVLGLVDGVLQASGTTVKALDAIAVIVGPGSFTGLRIGVSVAQGLAFGAGLTVIPVSSLALLAAAAREQRGVPAALACMQARPGEYYWAHYLFPNDQPLLAGSEQVGTLSQLLTVFHGEAQPESGTAPTLVTDSVLSEELRAGLLGQEVVRVHADADTLARTARLLAGHKDGSVAPQYVRPVYLKEELDYRKVSR